VAAITSAANGDWNDGATWVGGVKPAADTDTAVIAHDVVVTTTESVGNSPVAGTAVVTINAGKTLTINPGGSLTVKGDISIAAASVMQVGTASGGGTLTFDGTSGTVKYMARGAGAAAVFRSRGTTASRSSILSLGAGTANGSITHNEVAFPFIIDCEQTDFSKIGDGTVPGLRYRSSVSGDILQLTDCTLDSCGAIASALAQHATSIYSLVRVKCTNTVPSSPLSIGNTPNTLTSGTRQIINCYFDKAVASLTILQGFTITDCVFQAAFSGSTSATTYPATFARNLVRGACGNTTWDFTDCYLLLDDTTGNTTFLSGIHKARNQTISGVLFEKTHKETADLGTCIAPNLTTASATALTITGCLVLPNGNAAYPSGNFLTINTGNETFVTVTADHCTFYATQARGGLEVNEAAACPAGIVGSFRSNIAWGPSSGTGYKAMDVGADAAADDVVSAANCDYNCGYNLGAGSNGKGYHELEFSSGTPGDNDIDVDPQFVDTTRCLPTFATDYLGKTGSAWADATAYSVGDLALATTTAYYGGQPVLYRCITAHTSNAANSTNGKPGDGDNVASWRTNWEFASLYYLRDGASQAAGYDANATVANLVTWIKAGYAVRNSLLRNAGHDNVTIGAMEYQASGSVAPVLLAIGVI
jgi:hypothetical protein